MNTFQNIPDSSLRLKEYKFEESSKQFNPPANIDEALIELDKNIEQFLNENDSIIKSGTKRRY